MFFSFASGFSLVEHVKKFLFGYTHVVGHFSDNFVLLLDDLLRLKVVNVFVVLSWHTESFFKFINLVFFLSYDLLKTLFNAVLTLELHRDKGLI